MAKGIILPSEIAAAHFCMEEAIRLGASAARVSLGKSVMDTCSMRDGEIDKVSHNSDCSIYLTVFVDGKAGNFSTNRLETEELESFVGKAVSTARLLAPDSCKHLQDPSLTASNASQGDELGLYDVHWHEFTPEKRLEYASLPSLGMKTLHPEAGENWKLVSEESEWSDGLDDSYLIDTNGFVGRHIETSFSYCSELTIEDAHGCKYSGYWWECAPHFDELDWKDCPQIALRKAVEQLSPARSRGGYRTVVVDSAVSSRLFSPIIGALNAMSIQQKNSFLEGKLGSKVFSDKLILRDLPLSFGKSGARLFDTEGTATIDRTIIDRGVVKDYFVNTYAAEKTGLAPTIEGISVPVIEPFCTIGGLTPDAEAMMRRFRNGIYVTLFNGGNCNPVTGDFSYGVSGFVFRDGKVKAPFREGLITGNMIELWNNIEAAGSDARAASRWQIPSLSFKNVSFSIA